MGTESNRPSKTSTSAESFTASEDGEFLVMRYASDNRWRWSWIAATGNVGVTIEGMRGFNTKAGALIAARAARKRLVAYCKGLK